MAYGSISVVGEALVIHLQRIWVFNTFTPPIFKSLMTNCVSFGGNIKIGNEERGSK
jgi:hypothetical protein